MRTENRRGVVLVVVVVAVLALGAVFWRLSPSGSPAQVGAAPAVTELVQQYEPAERRSITPFTASMLDGTQLDSTDLLGRPTVVNVWGSWCGPCRVEAPSLSRVARQFEGKVHFLGLNVRDSPDAARAFERAFEVAYPSVHPDDSSRAILAFSGALTAAVGPDDNPARRAGQDRGTRRRGGGRLYPAWSRGGRAQRDREAQRQPARLTSP